MVNRRVIALKLAELSDRIARVREACPRSLDEFKNDRTASDVTSFNLMLSVQTCSDIASHLIADEKWTPAGRLSDAFDRLRDHKVISERCAKALANAVGLRNVIAHAYSGVDYEKVHSAAIHGIDDLELFLQEVSRWMTSGSGA